MKTRDRASPQSSVNSAIRDGEALRGENEVLTMRLKSMHVLGRMSKRPVEGFLMSESTRFRVALKSKLVPWSGEGG